MALQGLLPLPAFILLGVLLVVTSHIYRTRSFSVRRPTKVLSTSEEIRDLLDPINISLADQLQARALPNQRLVRAFGISQSTFTSSSMAIHRTFRQNAMSRLKKVDSPERWPIFRDKVDGIIGHYLLRGHQGSEGDYIQFIRTVVFVSAMAIFFDYSGPLPGPDQVNLVTGWINEQWLLSKDPKDPKFEGYSAKRSEATILLRQWIPHRDKDPFSQQPLELILPAYETLWRLVAHTFIYVEATPAYRLVFHKFFSDPSKKEFKITYATLHSASVSDVIQEVLRLHPPTKRIKRAQVNSPLPIIRRARILLNLFVPSTSGLEIAADIESLQRSTVWDPLPHEFVAERHKDPTAAQRKAMMPFGIGPLQCIAASMAPRLAGLIVAGIARREDICLIRGTKRGDREGWEGWKIRKLIID